MASQFLFNVALWQELAVRIPAATKVRVAIAYLGTGAASLLPLRKGDVLVVDMSLPRVRAGATNPHEVKKYLRRGVRVFSRASLHAKFLIIDDVVIAGSSNVSSHAKHDLDEAALLTSDTAAVKRASAVFEQLCTEPVRKAYLDKCIEAYRPPVFIGGPRRGGNEKVSPAKLWLIGNLHYSDLPARERSSADAAVDVMAKRLLDFERCEVDYSHYPDNRGRFKKKR